MAALVITPAQVAVVKSYDESTLPEGETVEVGAYVRMDANGRFLNGNATNATELGQRRGLAVEKLATAVRVIHNGLLDLGDALDSVAIGALVYVSDTDASLDTAAGTVSLIAGVVVAGVAEVTAEKLLRFDVTL